METLSALLYTSLDIDSKPGSYSSGYPGANAGNTTLLGLDGETTIIVNNFLILIVTISSSAYIKYSKLNFRFLPPMTHKAFHKGCNQ